MGRAGSARRRIDGKRGQDKFGCVKFLRESYELFSRKSNFKSSRCSGGIISRWSRRGRKQNWYCGVPEARRPSSCVGEVRMRPGKIARGIQSKQSNLENARLQARKRSITWSYGCEEVTTDGEQFKRTHTMRKIFPTSHI